MNIGDNPFDDGFDFVDCEAQPTKPELPDFPADFKNECKLICWGRCSSFPDGERTMVVKILNFKPIRKLCGVYQGDIHFIDELTGEEWYVGQKMRFYYTRNYLNLESNNKEKTIAFRFIVKGDIQRVSDNMPEWTGLILCSKKSEEVESYQDIFIYGGLDIFYDVEIEKMRGIRLSLGHNDGWFTHHPECSKRPIDWHDRGDYIGHYCDRGWFFVSPGKNFIFEPNMKPPTGRFVDEALREIEERCYTEEAIENGALNLAHQQCIHSYQQLKGETICGTSVISAKSCQGAVYSEKKDPFITFFSMGYWIDRYEKPVQILHLAEGKIGVNNEKYNGKYGKELYFYGFATQNSTKGLKLVDLASNKNIIGAPAATNLLLYMYNSMNIKGNPKVLRPLTMDLTISKRLLKEEREAMKKKEPCPFLK